MTPSSKQTDLAHARHWWGPVLFPDRYLWLVFLSALDVMLTRVILFLGGAEVNPVADAVIHDWGMPGLSVFKFLIIAFVIVSCEYIGRTSRRQGRRLAIIGVFIAAFPVLWSSILLIQMSMEGGASEMLIQPHAFPVGQ